MEDPTSAPSALPQGALESPCDGLPLPEKEEGDDPAHRRVIALIELLGRRLERGTDERIQGLAADVVVALADLQFLPDADVQIARAELVIGQLLSSPPNRVLAERLTLELRHRAGGPALRLLRRALRVVPPQVAVVLGLVGALLIFGPGGYLGAVLAHRLFSGHGLLPGAEIANLMWIGFVGAHGSLLSILVRLRDFKRPQLPL